MLNKVKVTILMLFLCTQGCASPIVNYSSTIPEIKDKIIYLLPSNDVDGFQLALINSLSTLGIETIDSTFGEQRIDKNNDNSYSKYSKIPTEVGIDYSYEALYGYGNPITMSFQGKVIDYTTGKVLLTYSIGRGAITGHDLNATAVDFANKIAEIF